MYFQLPEEARELDKEVRQIVKEKEEAVRNQDFEKVLIYNCVVFSLNKFSTSESTALI